MIETIKEKLQRLYLLIQDGESEANLLTALDEIFRDLDALKRNLEGE